MKRSISRSLLNQGKNTDDGTTPTDRSLLPPEFREAADPTASPKARLGGAGSAWKAGALSQTQSELDRRREEIAESILAGQHELQLDPARIIDRIGSDRRTDWRDQDAFRVLRESIEKNGQDTPIHVWPSDPAWRPDTLDPEKLEGVSFLLITGRRRQAIAQLLGRKVRAILATPKNRKGDNDRFEMLFMRFRENEERENLSAFERLLSIGEMYESYRIASIESKTTAVSFAALIAVHESAVSRGRALLKIKDEILHACKNVFGLNYRELEKLITEHSETAKLPSKSPAKPPKIAISRKIGKREILLTSQGGRLSVSASGLNLDKDTLQALGDVITGFLEEKGVANKSSS